MARGGENGIERILTLMGRQIDVKQAGGAGPVICARAGAASPREAERMMVVRIVKWTKIEVGGGKEEKHKIRFRRR